MEKKATFSELLKRYDIPVPRYTSYPAIPYWDLGFTPEDWLHPLRTGVEEIQEGWALYLHIPFCETLCTFCGCNNIITKNHRLEGEYLELLKLEFELYLNHLPRLKSLPLRQIHLGGGSPTFLSAGHLADLVGHIMGLCTTDTEHFEGSIEVDPRRTTKEQLEELSHLEFHRISIGVQDLDPKVQDLVNRRQPFECVERVTDWARLFGYNSINLDLIYGLPAQTLSSFAETIKTTLFLRPERIALYSLAIVPWIKPAQKLFSDKDLPTADLKRDLYEMARSLFLQEGYQEIGIDHFALPSDALALAQKSKALHRNFMGYTDQNSELVLALGVSAISESKYGYHQNQKNLASYTADLMENRIPTLKGHFFSAEDRKARQQILSLMTNFESEDLSTEELPDIASFLKQMIVDGLVEIHKDRLRITTQGVPFVRNVCTAFDSYFRAETSRTPMFSSSV